MKNQVFPRYREYLNAVTFNLSNPKEIKRSNPYERHTKILQWKTAD